MPSPERQLEDQLVDKLVGLKCRHRSDIRDRVSLERNFRQKFEVLNAVHPADVGFIRLLDEIVTPDVYTAAKTLRGVNAFTREDGTPRNYTMVNIQNRRKSTSDVVDQLRINTDNNYYQYDVLLVNGGPVTQVEFKALVTVPSRAVDQVIDSGIGLWPNSSSRA